MTGDEDRIQQGRRLRQMRSERSHPDSPCRRCKRDFCPSRCFPCLDWEKRRRKMFRMDRVNYDLKGRPMKKDGPTE